MRNNTASLSLPGGSSRLTVFACLCLTVFALLSLSGVAARQRLSDSALASVSAYYAADAQAERTFALLRNGSIPPKVEQDGDIFRYDCAISENRRLYVELERTENEWRVLRWQEQVTALEADDTIPVWDGK